ncbi:Uncharacterised protein [Actinomyces bovis]|uniref:Uncharacterized protein n=1 Tax=Actinomyces bovis TaxID=1658 RepID=A0ABY1VL77_9ACTO|nr:hypothetical protein [Actinomyces bovis]SPT52840.1 Uncharacterised protein [Actinomyces bovis]VEG54916.1 Uncharacterised protein [Actinomyces israelii]
MDGAPETRSRVPQEGLVLLGRDGEDLREWAIELLTPIDQDRLSRDLLEQGLPPQEVALRVGTELRFVLGVQQHLESGEEIRPVTAKELGWRRAAGQISTEEMMERLRSWPYTFGQVRGYDGYESGSWDDIESLRFDRFISAEEYDELYEVAETLPTLTDEPYDSPELWAP